MSIQIHNLNMLLDQYTEYMKLQINHNDSSTMICADMATHQDNAQFRQYLGMTRQALSDKGIEIRNEFPDTVERGQFLFYRETDAAPMRLIQCLSALNGAKEFSALTTRITRYKIEKKYLRMTDIAINVNTDGYLNIGTQYKINENDIEEGGVAEWTNLKNEKMLLVITKCIDDKMVRCTQFIPEIITVQYNNKNCIVSCCGDASAIHERYKEIDPPYSELVAGSECLCSFMATFQNEVSIRTPHFSINKYFCTNPNKQHYTTNWKIFIEYNKGEEIGSHGLDECTYTQTNNIVTFRKTNFHIFLNIFIIIRHWARHDARKGLKADKLLWHPNRSYSPYDISYRPLPARDAESMLRMSDFTISQCIRIWLNGVFLHYEQEMPQDQMIKQLETSIRNALRELMFMFNDTNRNPSRPDPIYKANKDINEQTYEEYKQRAKQIIRHSLNEVFVTITPTDSDPITDKYIEDVVCEIVSAASAIEITETYPLQYKSIESLVGSYIPRDDMPEVYQILISYRSPRPVLLYYTLNQNDIILIFDQDGVKVAYFHSIEWVYKSKTLQAEIEYSRRHHTPRANPVNDRRIRDITFKRLQYNVAIPLIYYHTGDIENAIALDQFERDLPNIYTLKFH